MEVDKAQGDALVVAEGEDFLGRRRSARCSGKKRPSYVYEKQTVVNEKKLVVRKKRKLSPVKKEPKIPLPTGEPNGLVVQTEIFPACGKEVKINGLLKPEIGTLDHSLFSASDRKDASADSEIVEQKGHILNNGVFCGDGSDPHKLPMKSDKQRVRETLRIFNTYYLQLIQEEEKRVKETVESRSKSSKRKNGAESKQNLKRPSMRPDLKAVSKMQINKQVLYPDKKIGDLPGISVGDQFFSRAEMCVLGLHHHWLNGIDYIGETLGKKGPYKGYPFPLAVGIVLSGMYEDDLDNSEDVVYTGQGGHDLLGNKRQIGDQKLERGNLALKNNFELGVPVRVVRGHGSKSSYCGKVYTYDGLYEVVKYWVEKGVAGFTVYKYKLRRVKGQPALTTNQVQFARARAPLSISELRGLVCEDISGGQENLPIPATNVVDYPACGPTDFDYCKSVRLSKNIKLPRNALGCNCKGECVDPKTCSCAKLNGGDIPYVRKDGGRLIEAKAVVFECGPGCGCSKTCVNRTSQRGLRYRLEVFRTASKGWAVRSWDTIPSGAPVCEYTGILTRTDEIEADLENNYIFDIDCLQTMKGLDGRERRPGDMAVMANLDDKNADPEFCIDAGRVGGVARFINHSCEPNLFIQCVLSTHHDIKMAKVMLFAADTIPPLQELCYDYGYALDSVVRPDGTVVKLPCYCGAVGCRKRLY